MFELSKKQEKKIVRAIRKAELNTSGEIRVHISTQHADNHLDKAISVFHQLNMTETQDRNGVLFHVCTIDKNFTILGDEGISKVVPDDFWKKINKKVIKKFKKKKYTKGLVKGILMTGEALKAYFPYQSNDNNELPDEISRD